MSKDRATLLRAFTVYVRPLLEYASTVWSPYQIGDIDKLESVQRHFTKRLQGMHSKSYSDRMKLLGLESLEVRRLRADLLYTYKLLFGHVNIDWSNMFTLHYGINTRGHKYKLFVQHSRVNVRKYFYCNRVIKVWNSLPADTADFVSITAFKRLIYSADLSGFIKFV